MGKERKMIIYGEWRTIRVWGEYGRMIRVCGECGG